MGLLDKALNNMIGWENQTIQPTEMAEMIEETVLKNGTQEDLVKLEKAVNKTWVLAVGNGMSTRQVELCGNKYRFAVNYSVVFHTLTSVEFWDMEHKVNYYLPKGRTNAETLCQSVLSRITRYKK